jgi:hypothetical protein
VSQAVKIGLDDAIIENFGVYLKTMSASVTEEQSKLYLEVCKHYIAVIESRLTFFSHLEPLVCFLIVI